MLDGSLYHTVYLLLLTVLTFSCSNKYSLYTEQRIESRIKQPLAGTAVLTALMILFIGLRPLHRCFVDMMNYNLFYKTAALNDTFIFDVNTNNIIFDNLFSYLAINDYPVSVFFFIIAFVYFGCIAWAIRRFFPCDTLYALIIYLSAFSTFSYGTNGIKAGAAAAIFLVALSYRNKPIMLLFLSLLSWCFHHSMFMVIASYIVTIFVKDSKYYFWFWIICILCSIVHFNPLYSLMIGFSDEQGLVYLTSDNTDWGGKTGFRLDFIIYSAVPIIVGYNAIFVLGIKNAIYSSMYNLYLMCNSLWILCMYIPYNNRIAYLSWFMLPIVSIYPMLNLKMRTDQYRLLNTVAYIYLAFSLFMNFI